MPKEMVLRLIREAAMHLSDASSSASLREISRKFLDQNKIANSNFLKEKR